MDPTVDPPGGEYDYLAGVTLLVDKPQGWTSFDVVNKIRYHLRKKLGVRKLKVGHSGTLDPMATGLLIICTGRYTKKLADFQGLDKVYTGTMTLGATTPSYDAETPIDETFPTDHITPEKIAQAREQLTGPQEQYPPIYSAIKVDGQPLYKKARKGEKVEVKARPIEIYQFDLTGIELPLVHFRVHCSKGTYIRSLAYDFGKALDSGGYLSALRRTAVGDYQIDDAWQLDDLIARIDGAEPD